LRGKPSVEFQKASAMRVKPLERFETEERCRRVVDPLASPVAGDGEVPVEARNRSEG